MSNRIILGYCCEFNWSRKDMYGWLLYHWEWSQRKRKRFHNWDWLELFCITRKVDVLGSYKGKLFANFVNAKQTLRFCVKVFFNIQWSFDISLPEVISWINYVINHALKSNFSRWDVKSKGSIKLSIFIIEISRDDHYVLLCCQ